MAKKKEVLLKTTPNNLKKDFTFEKVNHAIIKFSNAVILDVVFDTETRQLSCNLTNNVDNIKLSGVVVLTESEV